ncbi:MAG: hypothetical protein Q7S07_02265 [Candidatus Omnitrophota bacterium]|nr:hypothetical protein [Candidatus Omnitrophota bacterium]
MVRRIALPFKVNKPILACGADLKGAFALAKGKEAILVDGFGDLGDLDNFTRYARAVKNYRKKLGIKPRVIACDLHPDYFSTRFAKAYILNLEPCALYPVQHHEAHIASAIVDNNVRGNIIGVAFDGTGYGLDGNIWGGEFFTGGLKGFRREAHLEYIPMPGGETAITEPWRMAVSYLYHAYGRKFFTNGCSRVVKKNISGILSMIDKNINSPLTSSAGRLFDAAGSLILAKAGVSKEAELPIELERLILPGSRGSYKFRFRADGEGIIIDTKEIVKGIVKDLQGKAGRREISCKFHNTIADVIAKTVLKLSGKSGIKQALLSGGVFRNRYLTAKAIELLEAFGLKAYTHSNIPTGDSGIPLGQIAIANARH